MDILKWCPEPFKSELENWVNNTEFKWIDPEIQKIINRDFWEFV